jgi:DNA mismatch endonuclease (patch repair protein)
MSRIKSKNTLPELLVRKYIFSRGLRYRVNYPKLPGRPDIVLPKFKTVIFVHGCFWHGHESCRYFKLPKTRTDWWASKINRNKINDSKVNSMLVNLGWKLIEIWECELKSHSRQDFLNSVFERIIKDSYGD